MRVEKRISFPEARQLVEAKIRLWSLEVRPTPLPLPPEENPNTLNVRHP